MTLAKARPRQRLYGAMLPAALLAVISYPYCLAGSLTSLPLFNEGVQAYNQRHYAEALRKFNTCIQSGHNTDMVHYYMALCYQAQSQISQAKAEYSLVSAQSHDPTLRANAQNALSSIDRWSAHRNYQGNGNVFQRYSRPSTPSLNSGATIAARIREGSGISVPSRMQDPDCPPSG